MSSRSLRSENVGDLINQTPTGHATSKNVEEVGHQDMGDEINSIVQLKNSEIGPNQDVEVIMGSTAHTEKDSGMSVDHETEDASAGGRRSMEKVKKGDVPSGDTLVLNVVQQLVRGSSDSGVSFNTAFSMNSADISLEPEEKPDVRADRKAEDASVGGRSMEEVKEEDAPSGDTLVLNNIPRSVLEPADSQMTFNTAFSMNPADACLEPEEKAEDGSVVDRDEDKKVDETIQTTQLENDPDMRADHEAEDTSVGGKGMEDVKEGDIPTDGTLASKNRQQSASEFSDFQMSFKAAVSTDPVDISLGLKEKAEDGPVGDRSKNLVLKDLSNLDTGGASTPGTVDARDASFDQSESSYDSKPKIDFLKDDNMTYGRRLALFLMKHKWYYNPEPVSGILDEESGAKESSPSLEMAWAFFEHTTLPRHHSEDVEGEMQQGGETTTTSSCVQALLNYMFRGERQLHNANPGEDVHKTELYSPINTPLSQMGDFGLGTGLYFSTLRAIIVMMVIAAFFNIPNFIIFNSDGYSGGQKSVSWYLKGSAVCDRNEWVPCPGCSKDKNKFESYRIQNATETEMTFALKNMCQGDLFTVGMVNFFTTLLVAFGLIIMAIWLHKKEIDFDEDEQTAQDYSIVVANPPNDATDPDMWKEFFTSRFHVDVSFCTVGIDNHDLLKALVKRRELLKQIKSSIPENNDVDVEDMDNLKDLASRLDGKEDKTFGQLLTYKIFGGMTKQYQRLVELNEQIVELSQKRYAAAKVYLSFETEAAQRLVLENMSVSRLDAIKNRGMALKDQAYLFDGKHVLDVREPAEPSAIRWKSLKITKKHALVHYVLTMFVLLMVYIFGYLTFEVNKRDPSLAAIVTALSNIIIPSVAKVISSLERHSNEENRQVWLYIKIAIFRWVNTVLVIAAIKPYTATIMNGPSNLLDYVYVTFYAEIVTSTLLQLVDLGGNFSRHYLAPRAKTQEDMELCMQGSQIFLAERYTNMTKLLFMGVYFCPIYPAVFILCAVALITNYFTDRFSIMRSWKPAPKVGISISRFTREVIFPILIYAMVTQAVFNWSNLPYDALCVDEGALANTGTYQLNRLDQVEFKLLEREFDTVTVGEESVAYRHCDSGFQTTGQIRLLSTYKKLQSFVYFMNIMVSIAVIVVYYRKYFVSTYKPAGDDQNIKFSEVKSRACYIPEVKSDFFSFPLLACPVDDILDCGLIKWQAPYGRSYAYYDLTKDVKKLLEANGQAMGEGLFSKIVSYEEQFLKKM